MIRKSLGDKQMITLSHDTERLLDEVIPAEDRDRIRSRILLEVSEGIPFCEGSGPMEMERIRFSVIRLLLEGTMAEDDVFELACTDWRDLFLAARHGGTEEHKKWAKDVLKADT